MQQQQQQPLEPLHPATKQVYRLKTVGDILDQVHIDRFDMFAIALKHHLRFRWLLKSATEGHMSLADPGTMHWRDDDVFTNLWPQLMKNQVTGEVAPQWLLDKVKEVARCACSDQYFLMLTQRQMARVIQPGTWMIRTIEDMYKVPLWWIDDMLLGLRRMLVFSTMQKENMPQPRAFVFQPQIMPKK